VFWTITALPSSSAFLLIIPIGGADMPVVVSMLNSYSGWAAAAMGFTLHNTAMIITGALVGSSGAILSYIMCKAMNRSFISVIAGGFGAERGAAAARPRNRPWKRGSAEDAAYMMQQAEQRHHRPRLRHGGCAGAACAARNGDVLKRTGRQRQIRHPPRCGPYAGPHERAARRGERCLMTKCSSLRISTANLRRADVAFIIGANDVVNPAAKTDKTSPIYGMPVFDVDKAKTVFFIKRSMGGVGYAGVDNDVFYMDQTMMISSKPRIRSLTPRRWSRISLTVTFDFESAGPTAACNAPLLIESLNFCDIGKATTASRTGTMSASVLIDVGASRLEASWAQRAILICANSMHKVYDRVLQRGLSLSRSSTSPMPSGKK
jgi:hypothetical protein